MGLFGNSFFGNPTPQTNNFGNIAPQAGAAIQHSLAPTGQHQMASVQQAKSGWQGHPASPALSGPQGTHNFAPQGQQWANQQAQVAQQKALAEALRKQQEEAAAAQAAQEAANQQSDYGYYSG